MRERRAACSARTHRRRDRARARAGRLRRGRGRRRLRSRRFRHLSGGGCLRRPPLRAVPRLSFEPAPRHARRWERPVERRAALRAAVSGGSRRWALPRRAGGGRPLSQQLAAPALRLDDPEQRGPLRAARPRRQPGRRSRRLHDGDAMDDAAEHVDDARRALAGRPDDGRRARRPRGGRAAHQRSPRLERPDRHRARERPGHDRVLGDRQRRPDGRPQGLRDRRRGGRQRLDPVASRGAGRRWCALHRVPRVHARRGERRLRDRLRRGQPGRVHRRHRHHRQDGDAGTRALVSHRRRQAHDGRPRRGSPRIRRLTGKRETASCCSATPATSTG